MLRVLSRLAVPAAFVTSCTLLLSSSQAADPSSGTIGPASTTLTYGGGPFVAANDSGAAGDLPVCSHSGPDCDVYTLTVALPADYHTTNPNDIIVVTVNWPQPSGQEDFDLYWVDSSGGEVTRSAGSAEPEVMSIPACPQEDGSPVNYEIWTIPFLPNGQSYTATVELVTTANEVVCPGGPGGDDDLDNDGVTNDIDACPGTPIGTSVDAVGCPLPPPGPGVPRYHTFQAPNDVDIGEPSIGCNWQSEQVFTNTNVDGTTNSIPNGGTVTYFGGFSPYMFKIVFDDCASPANFTWDSKPLISASSPRVFGDPILFTDNQTGRTWTVQLEGLTPAGSTIDITDDDGETFIPSDGVPGSDIDHETLAAGPYHAPLVSPPPPAYPNAVYYASQSIAEARVHRSDNGGLLFGPGTVMWNILDCTGLHGHLKVAPDGTVFIPPRSCNGGAAVAVSEDNGITWELRPIPNASLDGADSDPSIGVATDSKTIYVGMDSSDGRAMVAKSNNYGLPGSWTTPVDVGANVVNGKPVCHMVWPEMVAGDPDRAAMAFFGTESCASNPHDASFPGAWYLYVATTYDGGATWYTENVTPGDPIQRGGICGGGTCRNLLDFFDATIDKEGRVLVGAEDGCITSTCINGGPNDFTARGLIARQVGGRRMFAAYDDETLEPARPAAPKIGGGLSADLATANLTWGKPDHAGSPITSYKVYKREGIGAFKFLAEVPVANYSDTSYDNSIETFYHVTAVNGIGEGPYCKDFKPEFVEVQNPCEIPGVRALNDMLEDGSDGDSGANTPPDPSTNVRELWIAEPDLGGASELVMTMNLAPASVAAPNSEWFIVWNRAAPDANFDRWYVAMRTDGTGAASFEYGRFGVPLNPTSPNPNANTPVKLGDLTSPANSYDPATGAVRIHVPTANAENVGAGDSLPGLNIRTYAGRNGAAGQRSQNNASDITGDGTYTLVGNAFCIVNNPPIATMTAAPTSGTAPLTVAFDASASADPDAGDMVASYTFDLGDGSGQDGAGFTQSTPTLTHEYTVPGTYTATLTVRDSRGAASVGTFSLEITVTAPPVNHPPVANAGPDSDIDEGATALLYGGDSSDEDGDSITYEWTQNSGPAVMLQDADTATPKFAAPEVNADTLVAFTLVVTDEFGVPSLPDEVVVDILNQLPTAQVGGNNQVSGAVPPLTLLALALLALRRRRRM